MWNNEQGVNNECNKSKMIDLMHGDCLELMKQIPDKSVDMILCDLPYGTTACKWDFVIPFDKLWSAYKRITKDNGAIVLFCKQPFTTELIHSNLKDYKYSVIWKKDNHDNPLMAKNDFLILRKILLSFIKSNALITRAALLRLIKSQSKVGVRAYHKKINAMLNIGNNTLITLKIFFRLIVICLTFTPPKSP